MTPTFLHGHSEKGVLYIRADMVFYIKIHKNLVLFQKLILKHFETSSNC